MTTRTASKARLQTPRPATAVCDDCHGSGTVHVGWCKDAGAIAVACRRCRGTRPRRDDTALYGLVAVAVLAAGWLLIF